MMNSTRMFSELERQSNRAATRTDQEPTLSDYLKETLELCYKYETEGVSYSIMLTNATVD